MDRNIVYPGAIPLDTDLLYTNRNTMVALGALMAATLGTSTTVDGLVVGPTSPASLNVTVGAGTIIQYGQVDSSAYGSLAADTDNLMKMGINLEATNFTLTVPTTAGTSISYLIEATFQETDSDPVVLPYYNATTPSQPYLGPNNAGTSQATMRVQQVALQLKAGAAAVTGTQAMPPVDTGYVGLAVITVNNGQVQVTAQNITSIAATRCIPYKLPDLRPGFSQHTVFTASGSFTVPAGVSTVKVTVIGGGGAGGTHATLSAAGGGAGGQAMMLVSGLTSGSVIPVTVGGGGTASTTAGNGGAGGTSSFGTYVSATGGQGGTGGSAAATCAGGAGGAGVGGDANFGGSYGTDAIPVAQRGGDGGGPGGGRGTSGLIQGIGATGPGGGGGGGGASAATGGTGAQGGNGAAGMVIVEY